MSYNNYVDADAALRAAYDFDEPAVAVISTTTPVVSPWQPRCRRSDCGRSREGSRLRPAVRIRWRDCR